MISRNNLVISQQLEDLIEPLGFQERAECKSKTLPEIIINTTNDTRKDAGLSFIKDSENTNFLIETIKSMRNNLSFLLCKFDLESFSHSVNVAYYAMLIGLKLNLKKKELKELIIGGFLHDLGKLVIPLEILKKNGPLTSEEFALIKKHPAKGYALLSTFDYFPLSVLCVCRQHHERIDGSGYPFGLYGYEVHDFSKIISIADVFEALTADRSYRKGHSFSQALEIIRAKEECFEKDLIGLFK